MKQKKAIVLLLVLGAVGFAMIYGLTLTSTPAVALADGSCGVQTSCQACNASCPSVCVAGCSTPAGCSALTAIPACPPTHKTCVNQSCTTVDGAGTSSCTSDADCKISTGTGTASTPGSTGPAGSSCTGHETSGPCRPDITASENSCLPGTKFVNGLGQGQCLVGTVNGNEYHNYCLGTETTGPCAPTRINKTAADAAAAACETDPICSRPGEICSAQQDIFPAEGGDPTTGLNYFFVTVCSPPGGEGTTSGSGGGTNPGQGGGNTSGGSTNPNGAISAVVGALERSILNYRASAAAKAQTQANAAIGNGTAAQTTSTKSLLTALQLSLVNISSALAAGSGNVSQSTITGVSNMLTLMTQIIQALRTSAP